jgi:tetratricopeptide (TPR) repeat protein
LLLTQTSKPLEAEAEFCRALEIYGKLADDDPAVSVFRWQLANSHNSLGAVLSGTGKPSQAEAEFRLVLKICQKLADDNPGIPDHRNLLAAGHINLSVVLRRLGQTAKARDSCDQAIAIREALVQEVPKVPMYRSNLAYSYLRHGLARGDLSDPVGAAADTRRAIALWEGLPSRRGEEWFEAACAQAALASLAGRAGSGVSTAEAVTEADAAMALLRRAVAQGHRRPDAYRTEDVLDPLRSRDDFRLLMMDLARPIRSPRHADRPVHVKPSSMSRNGHPACLSPLLPNSLDLLVPPQCRLPVRPRERRHHGCGVAHGEAGPGDILLIRLERSELRSRHCAIAKNPRRSPKEFMMTPCSRERCPDAASPRSNLRIDTPRAANRRLAEVFSKPAPIHVIAHDLLTAVAADREVVNRAGVLEA